MKTYNAQIEEVKDLLDNISGLAIDYDCLSGEEDMKGLIDSMSNWACEALKILEELPRDSRGKEEQLITAIKEIISDAMGTDYHLSYHEIDKILKVLHGAKNNADK